MPECLILLIMAGVFIVLALPLKVPLGIALALAAIAGALTGGHGFALRHLVEGAFGFFDLILVIASAMIFMRVLQESGALDSLVGLILRTFQKRKALLLWMLMLVLMLPGMLTGSSLASVLSTGPLIAPILMTLGLPRAKAAAFVALGAVLGMIAPPVNILVMIMGAGVDMPYVGLTAPLLLLVIPLAIALPLILGAKHLRSATANEKGDLCSFSESRKPGIKLYVPLLLVLLLMVLQNFRVPVIPDMGLPAVFFLGSIAGLPSGRRFNYFKATQRAVADALPILSILAGIGMFVQVMALTGARGWAVGTLLSLPPLPLYAGMALSLPLFGGISAFGSASILGVPFLLALVGKNALITSSALSAIAGIGDLVPPAAVSVRFSSVITGEKSLFPVLRSCLVPALVMLGWGLTVLLLAPWLDRFM
jgi:GntP family gluconate:H+ symporter